MRATLEELSIFRWFLIITACRAAHRFSPKFCDWLGEVTGLNERLRAAISVIGISDGREAGSEPPSGLHAIS